MLKPCRQCAQQFEITPEDIAFYNKISPVFSGKKYEIPAPTLCPACRAQRRLAFRNERKLYNRKCDLSGKPTISMFSPDKQYTVYDQKGWWSDKWDALSYSQEFDFNKHFFAQFDALLHKVPQMNVIGEANENCDYCNLTANGKNNYLVFESSNNEDCLYGYWLQKCTDCCDLSYSHECILGYEIDDCFNCYNLIFSNSCTNCRDSAYLYDCIGCSDCLFCANLRNKQYYVFNEPHSKEDYEKIRTKIFNGSRKALVQAQNKFKDFLLKQPHRPVHMVNAENCTGDYIQNSKNLTDCYHAYDAEDCKYGEHVWRSSKNNMDVSTVGRNAELVYESINTAIDAFQNAFCIQCWSGSSNLLYCHQMFSSKNCFGCTGLRHKQYCILNKQCTKDEYEKLVPQIIEHMQKTKEWGEFFPVKISQFGYNETVAHENNPITKEHANQLGAKWQDDDVINKYDAGEHTLADAIQDTGESILKQILTCSVCGKNYRIIAKELEFHKKQNLPFTDVCPNCRHLNRINSRNPEKLFTRTCANCKSPIQTTYSTDRPEIVYCEKCYLEAVY